MWNCDYCGKEIRDLSKSYKPKRPDASGTYCCSRCCFEATGDRGKEFGVGNGCFVELVVLPFRIAIWIIKLAFKIIAFPFKLIFGGKK